MTNNSNRERGPTTIETHLAHVGVKGMKWGIRKDRGGSETARSFRDSGEKASELSEAAMRDRIKRLELEKRYSSLMEDEALNPSGPLAKGKTVVSEILVNSAKQTVQNYIAGKMGEVIAWAFQGTVLAVAGKKKK